MKLNFIKANPTDNMTVFILDPLPIELHKDVARKIISYGNLCAEQVGFLDHPSDHDGKLAHIRLRMMGGEFCGNATRALAAVMVDRDFPGLLKNGDAYRVNIDVSEAFDPIPCQVERMAGNTYSVSAKMPRYESLSSIEFEHLSESYRGTWVKYSGISHVVFFTKQVEIANGLIDAIKAAMQSYAGEALGIMLYDEEISFLTPIVHIPETATEIWERGCGSGSAAVATVLAARDGKDIEQEINQPGGCVTLSGQWANGQVREVILTGPVSIVAEGQVNI